ncbi:MAG: cytidylate kinase-like family protein [Lachnospiraceae bacterium]|nr:cytidylate kinase-like family protein [Lachnospiraceae bacterium]
MNTIITIGRQFGSGGHEIGNRIADYYGIKCYDKELIARTSSESGLSEEMIEHQEEKPHGSFLYSLVMDSFSFGYNASGLIDMPVGQKVFLAQFDAIKRIAQEGPCVIVGRCAEYALADFPKVLNIFVVADDDFKVKNLRQRFPDLKSDEAALELMKQKDKQRKQYHNYYATKRWGHADSYHLVVNSAVLGVEGTAKLVTQFVDDYEGQGAREGQI